MRNFEIKEIANGWLICYNTEQGYVQRFFTNVDEIVEVLKSIIPTKVEANHSVMVKDN